MQSCASGFHFARYYKYLLELVESREYFEGEGL